MDKLILENVRGFKGRHEIPLAPLTLLIGENSTGKSTLLSAVRLAWDIARGIRSLDFNEEPFNWGTYDQIAYSDNEQGDRAKQFTIGIVEDHLVTAGQNESYRRFKKQLSIEAIFVKQDVQPAIKAWDISCEPFHVRGNILDTNQLQIVLEENDNRSEMIFDFHMNPWDLGDSMSYSRQFTTTTPGWEYPGINDFISMVLSAHRRNYPHDEMIDVFPFFDLNPDKARPYAIAPIRSRPDRTYNRLRVARRPEGDHVPMVLANILSSEPKPWLNIREFLADFGLQSGLFSGIQIKTLGSESDPFQIQVLIEGRPVNLVDVGYGVSQTLPIVLDCILLEKVQILMQQPEVHLHPKAQAALGSFFGSLVTNHQKKQFIIETHSDYLIDRIRMDVRDGKILRADDVVFLYFEREGSQVKIHPIRLDDSGNLLDVPRGYRQFFLEEEERFLAG